MESGVGWRRLLSLPLAVYARFEPEDGGQVDESAEVLEVVARIRNNLHRSIQPNTAEQRFMTNKPAATAKIKKGQFLLLCCGRRCC